MKSNLLSVELINIPKIHDPRGNLAIIEKEVLPFRIERLYYLFDVPSGSKRGGHAHKELSQFLIALSGSFDVILKDGRNQQKITLNNPSVGLLVRPGIWRELENFSSGSVCLVAASNSYLEEDYIRNYDEYLEYNLSLK